MVIESQSRPSPQQSGKVQSGTSAASGPEALLSIQATKVVGATLDGDDSVGLVQAMLSEKAERAEPNKPIAKGEQEPPTRPEQATIVPEAVATTTDVPWTPPDLVKWLAAPAAVALATAGWLWRRSRRGRKNRPTH